MTDAVAMPTPTTAVPKVGKTVAVALLLGLSIQLIGTWSWVALARLNVRVQPEFPWAAATMACGLGLGLVWLSGRGWPRRTSAFRRHHLRLWRPEPGAWSGENLATIVGLSGAMVGLAAMYVLIGASRPPIDVSAYPITLRWSLLLMYGTVAGVVEEAAFRGYMQSHLERIGPAFSILVTSAVFTLLHAIHGPAYFFTFAPGIFIASVIYGHLAQKSGSILPGMALHIGGDAAYAYFALLGGNSALLFAK
jgi:membrane protease YdiL (CAAX protease family)